MAMQNHCKVITALFADGTGYTAEGSANLRSHSTTENVALTNDAGLFRFHEAWMEEGLAIPDEKPTTAPAADKPVAKWFQSAPRRPWSVDGHDGTGRTGKR